MTESTKSNLLNGQTTVNLGHHLENLTNKS
jgi:hypothetical protein